jgi:Zn finger protein HypA/HybF involved in hydrogenase expression
MQKTIIRQIKDVIKSLFECKHEKITTATRLGFCPDCGKKINLYWLIATCSECHTSRETVLIMGKPYSLVKKCPECKSTKYKIFKTKDIESFNSGDNQRYYVIVKEEVNAGPKQPDNKENQNLAHKKYYKSLKNNVSYSGLYKVNPKLLK